jgi:tryptophan synthase alpha chain
MAEGPVIQLGHERALAHKVGMRDVLAMVRQFRTDNSATPVVLMGYANPIEVLGYREFAQLAQEAGVDGVLTVDMPPEEAGELNNALAGAGMDAIFLIAPTTSVSRAEEICASASGYIYYVSLKGVTGAGHIDTDDVNQKVSAIKAMTDLPICVGFGIKDANSAATISGLADGVVVGSVLVDAMGGGAKADSPVRARTAEEVESINHSLAKIVKEISVGANR